MRWLAILLCLVTSSLAADLSWDWTQGEGGAADGFRIHYGSHSGIYTEQVDVGLVQQWHIPDAWPNGTYFFVASAYNSAGVSTYSNEAVYVRDFVSGIQPASGGSYQLAWIEDQPMTTVGPISIAADADDWFIQYYGGGWTFWSAYDNLLSFGEAGGETQWAGLRFLLPAGGIPSGCTINTASLVLRGTNAYSWLSTYDVRIYATDSDNAPQVTAIGGRPSLSGGSTILTAAYADWLNINWSTSGDNTSVDFANVIQELVDDNGGLAAGAYIVVWIGTYARTKHKLRSGGKHVCRGLRVYRRDRCGRNALFCYMESGGRFRPHDQQPECSFCHSSFYDNHCADWK